MTRRIGYGARSRGRGPAVSIALGMLLAFASNAHGGSEGRKLVVVLYPDESDGAPGIVLVNHAIRTTFANESPVPVDIRNEYVDTSRGRDAEFMKAQVLLLQRKYDGRKVDLVIAGLSSGLDFAVGYRDQLFPGVPIVFVAVDQWEAASRELPRDVIGAPIQMDIRGTMDLALRLHPHTHRVVVVAGNAPFDIAWEAEARQKLQTFSDRVELEYWIGLQMAELLDRAAHLPERTIIYYLHIHRDGVGKPFYPAEALERLAARASAPIYGHVDTYVGRGAVGGRVFTFEAEGRSAARIALRLLAGEKPESIAVGPSVNTDLFDWRELRRWGIDEDDLPPGSTILFRKPTFWDLYKWHMAGTAALCVLQALLIAILLIQRSRRRRADEQFRQVVETAPVGMLMIAPNGAIVLANAQVETLFGRERASLLGQPIAMLVPERFRNRLRADLSNVFAAPCVRSMSPGRELRGLRNDSDEFPIDIELSPFETHQGLFVLISVIDLTARRQAEEGLRISQRELKRLTARLLEAQETERRRIARELHDDVNQNLALLSVEMDLLGQSMANLPPDAESRVRELSVRIKTLSSSLHDLSHQLHPAKLEQLGLVAAVRSLGKELGYSHKLQVNFTHDPEPGPMRPDVALCLYRIVQEALQNVIKHSGSQHVAVDLSESAGSILLAIFDDGVGFELDALAGQMGLGFVSMRERLGLVGGTITIESRPSRGTRIQVRVPLSKRPESVPSGDAVTV